MDELWVALNTTMEREVMTELIKKFPKKVKFIYMNQRLGYGKPLNLLLECSPDGLVLLLEDDTIIFKKGIVKKYFDLLENGAYHLIGSPRMSCGKDVADKLKEEFELNYEGWGDRGPNFWPCFLWTHKSLLMKTDRNFDPTLWGDTFAWMSVQLRRILGGKKSKNYILEIPQYHCSPDDFENQKYLRGIFDGECGYMHLGSLSSGIESYLLDEKQVPLTDREAGIKAQNPKPIENTKDMQLRMMWWLQCYQTQRHFVPDWFNTVYQQAFGDALSKTTITFDDLEKWNDLYMGVIHD